MKKLKILIGFIVIVSISNAQVTFYKEFVGEGLMLTPVNASSPTPEECYRHIPDTQTVNLYNRQFELIKTFHFQSVASISSIYRNVFTKSGKMEFFANLRNFGVHNCYLVNEDGTVLFDFKEYSFFGICDDYLLMYKFEIINNRNQYKIRVYTLDNYDASVSDATHSNCSRVYPNPATSGFVNIEYEITQAETIEIFDASGKVLQTAVLTPGNTSLRMNFKQPAGIYFYKHQSGSGSFIVQ